MPEDITVFGVDLDKLTPEKGEEFISMVKTQFDEDFPEDKEGENPNKVVKR